MTKAASCPCTASDSRLVSLGPDVVQVESVADTASGTAAVGAEDVQATASSASATTPADSPGRR